MGSATGEITGDRRRRLFSRRYAAKSPRMETEGMGELRHELLAGLSGQVVEVGAGNGLNFAHYPGAVSQVMAIEPEPYLRELATETARKAPVEITVQAGTADRLPLADDCADAVVLCLVMCSLDNRRAGLAEVTRVLRIGGTVRFLEHTIAPSSGLRIVQRVFDATVGPALSGGCRTTNDPLGLLAASGFQVTEFRRFRFPNRRISLPSTPKVLGTAIPG